MIRTPQALIPYLFLCACVASGALWRLSEDAGVAASSAGVLVSAIGGPFALVDQNGMARSDKDFRGRYVLVYFGYSFCPDICPTTLTMMADALDRLGAKGARIVPLFITIDPARDTPQVLKPYLAAFGPRFVGLTGSDAAIAVAEHAYRVYAKKQPLKGGGYAMNHSSVIYLIGPDGKLVTFYDGATDSKMLANDLAKRVP
jgi:cytochrome oxidase Cu insertion factor (SCO1/SenC/PrrC family)